MSEENVNKKRKLKPFIIVLAIIVIAAGAFAVINVVKNRKTDRFSTVSESMLEKVVTISELNTVDYTYNAIADMNDSDGKCMYHVAYKGKVTAGIDAQKVEFEQDVENKKIYIIIPEAEIQNVSVDMGSMDFVFEKKKYETEDVAKDAYNACVDDLENKAAAESELLEIARENAGNAVKGLIGPWVEQVYEGYTVDIK